MGIVGFCMFWFVRWDDFRAFRYDVKVESVRVLLLLSEKTFVDPSNGDYVKYWGHT